jgi:hypothetical protein
VWLSPFLLKHPLLQEEMEEILLGEHGDNEQQSQYSGEKLAQQYRLLTAHHTAFLLV